MEQLKDSYHDGSSKTEYCHVYLRNKMKWQYIKSKYVAKIQIDNKIYHDGVTTYYWQGIQFKPYSKYNKSRGIIN